MDGSDRAFRQKRGRRTPATVALLVLLAAVGLGLLARRARVDSKSSDLRAPRAAADAEPRPAASDAGDRAESFAPSATGAVLSVLGGTPPGFQESVSAAYEGLRHQQPDLSPPVLMAAALRAGIFVSGGDPDRTVAYWLSPAFQRDLAGASPGDAADARRTVDSLLAQLLGDGLGDEEFERVLSLHAPDVREAARARRAAR